MDWSHLYENILSQSRTFGNITQSLVYVLEKIHLVRKMLLLPTDSPAACVCPKVDLVSWGGNTNLTSHCNLTYHDWGGKQKERFHKSCKTRHSRQLLENSTRNWQDPAPVLIEMSDPRERPCDVPLKQSFIWILFN